MSDGMNPGSSDERLRQLEQLLEEKDAKLSERDNIVNELTRRLSLTAEKLDRLKRVGSDGPVLQTASFPKEVVEQQTELVEELARAVQLWQDMQMSATMGRLEMQLADLHALCEDHFREEEPEPEEPEETNLAEEEAAAEEANEPAANDGEAGAEPSDSDEVLPDVDEICPVRPPDILELSEAREESLRRCVDQQEDYIDYLSARLQRYTEKQSAVDWEELSKDADKITQQLEFTATKIQESRNFAEFELALQQTRLKRRERDLSAVTKELERQLGRHQPAERNAGEQEAPGGQRWLRMLGVGNKNSNE